MTHKDHKEGWEERYDKMFEKEPVCEHGFKVSHYICEPHDYPHVLGNRFGPDCETCSPPPRPKVKAFIREELSHLLTKIQEMIEDEKYDIIDCSDFHDLTKGMSWTPCGACGCKRCDTPKRTGEQLKQFAHNSALENLSAKLKEIKQ